MKSVNHFFAIFSLIFALGCEPKVDIPPTPVDLKTDTSNILLVLNEGNFGWANASLSKINVSNNEIQNFTYKTINNKDLGDVAQSISIYNDKIYLIINGSANILILDKNSYKEEGQINGLTSPRYMVIHKNGLAAVSDLYSKSIQIIDLQNNTIIRKIPFNGWSEQFAIVNNEIWFNSYDNPYIYKLDEDLRSISDSLFIGNGSLEMSSFNNQIYVIRRFKEKGLNNALFCIKNRSIIDSIEFNSSNKLNKLTINPTSKKIFLLSEKHISEVDINDFSIANEIIKIDASSNIYDIYSYDKYLWLSDAIDFTSEGKVIEYDLNTLSKKDYQVDIIPGEMIFIP